MALRTRSRGRRVARTLAWLAPATLAVVMAGACSQLKGSLGDDCLKGEDCLSGVCSQLHCAAAPTLFDAQVLPDAGADAPGSGDSAAASGDGAPVSGDDATSPMDSTTTPPVDATSPDTGTEPTPDASSDAPGDDAADAPDGSDLNDARADGGDTG
jgi:hypothetical protein